MLILVDKSLLDDRDSVNELDDFNDREGNASETGHNIGSHKKAGQWDPSFKIKKNGP